MREAGVMAMLWKAMYKDATARIGVTFQFHQRSAVAHSMAMAPARHDAFEMLRTLSFRSNTQETPWQEKLYSHETYVH